MRASVLLLTLLACSASRPSGSTSSSGASTGSSGSTGTSAGLCAACDRHVDCASGFCSPAGRCQPATRCVAADACAPAGLACDARTGDCLCPAGSTGSSTSTGSTGSTASSSSTGSTGSAGSSTGSSGSTGGAPDAGPELLFGVDEEQFAVCYQGQGYPCDAVNRDGAERALLAQAAPGLAVRWGGYETERTGLGYPGNAYRRDPNLVQSQFEPAWLIERARLAGYGSWVLSVPVTWDQTGRAWTASDAEAGLDAWAAAIADGGFPPPAFIELGNEPWLHASGGPDGDTRNPAAYVAQATPIGQAVRAKIAAFGWSTRIAVVVGSWPGTAFEQAGHVLDYPQATVDLARQLAINGPPVLQTHGYPNNGGYWCPLPESQADHSDVACVYAFYTALRALKAAAPDADLIVTEDNYNSAAYPAGGVHTTLAALLTYAAGGVAFTHYAHNWQGSTGQRYELFSGGAPMPLVADLGRLSALLRGVRPGGVSVSVSGAVHVPSGGYPALVNAQSAPAPYQQGDAPTRYSFSVGGKPVSVDVSALSITWPP